MSSVGDNALGERLGSVPTAEETRAHFSGCLPRSGEMQVPQTAPNPDARESNVTAGTDGRMSHSDPCGEGGRSQMQQNVPHDSV